MTWVSVLLVALAVSVDGFWGGLAFGLRRTRVRAVHLLVVALISAACSAGAMTGGHALYQLVSLEAAKWVSALLLLAIGVTMLYEAYLEREKKSREPEEGDPVARERLVELRSNPLRYLALILADPTVIDADYSGDITGWEAMILGLAVAIDASIAAFTIGLAGHASALLPVAFGVSHYLLVGAGNLVGTRRLAHRLTNRFAYLPGGLLVVLGLLRIR